MIRDARGVGGLCPGAILAIQHDMCVFWFGCLAGGLAVGVFFEASLDLFDFCALGDEGLDAVLIDL